MVGSVPVGLRARCYGLWAATGCGDRLVGLQLKLGEQFPIVSWALDSGLLMPSRPFLCCCRWRACVLQLWLTASGAAAVAVAQISKGEPVRTVRVNVRTTAEQYEIRGFRRNVLEGF